MLATTKLQGNSVQHVKERARAGREFCSFIQLPTSSQAQASVQSSWAALSEMLCKRVTHTRGAAAGGQVGRGAEDQRAEGLFIWKGCETSCARWGGSPRLLRAAPSSHGNVANTTVPVGLGQEKEGVVLETEGGRSEHTVGSQHLVREEL